MPITCFYQLPELWGTRGYRVYPLCGLREDAQLLYGFNNKQEHALVRELIKVNSVGTKLALAILFRYVCDAVYQHGRA